MKKIIIAIALILLVGSLSAQILTPVKWSYSTSEVGPGEIQLNFKANIDPSWHLYGLHIPKMPSIETKFIFDKNAGIELVGKPREPKPIEAYDEMFEETIAYHEGAVTFSQRVKVKSEKDTKVTGTLTFMACDNKQCLPPEDVTFSFNVKGVPAAVQAAAPAAAEDQPADQSPGTEDTAVAADTATTDVVATDTLTAAEGTPVTAVAETNEKSSIWGLLALAFLGGLLAILTPCVFPMIPMIVSFFMQGSDNKGKTIAKALIFGLSIILLYALVGLIVSLTSAGADLGTVMSTSWVANLIFFLLFMAFALSFFGMFEIMLPSSLATKADQQVDKGGMIASFFMALTLVIVSFSCTGPIVGALLVKGAASGNWLEPTLGMAGFGLGFALPFTILAVSPSWLKKLPKSGGWMNAVKVVFGFILLAFSLKFLSNIDQAYNLNWISRDAYLAIWIAIFTLLGLYLLGKYKLSHDSDLKHVGVLRLLLALASFSFAIYMIPGLFGAELSAISSVIPPKTAQKFDLTSGVGTAGPVAALPNTLCDQPKYGDILHFPAGTQGYFDYEQARKCAVQQNKPLLVYFTGHNCSNCKKMQSSVWTDPRVIDYINNKYIVVKLYVDERSEAPQEDWFVSTVDGKEKKTVGRINMDRQIRDYGINTQPFYVIVDPNTEKPLVPETMKYETNPDVFIGFLDKGLAAK